jgi:hypothetical protein
MLKRARNKPQVFEPRLEEVLDFCAEEPVERVYLEDVARRGLGRFVATAAGGKLEALCHVGANVVPSGAGCAAFARAARSGRARMIIGEEQAVGELWERAGRRLRAPRVDRPGQPVYVLDEPPEAGDTGLREAAPDDLDLLVPACAAAHEDEIGVDPLVDDADGFRWRTRAQIGEGRSWLWAENGTILFKAEASAWTPHAVQLQRGLRDLCRRLLAQVPRVCLFVRAENAPAIRVYEAIGMRRTISYRSLIF